MRIAAEVKGLDSLMRKLDRIGGAHKDKAFEVGLAQGALVVVEEAQKIVPVDTGDLRDSLHVGGYTRLTPRYRKIGRYGALRPPEGRGRSKMVFLGSTLPYAHLVERGTRRMSARPYMRKAIDENQKQILGTIDNAVQAIIDEG